MPEQQIKSNGHSRLHALDKRLHAIITIVELLLAYSLIYILITMNIPEIKKDVVIYALGAITCHIGMTLSYWFGASKSSDDRDERAFQQSMIDKDKPNG